MKHSSLEKYTSHTLFERVTKGLRKGYVWEMSWRLYKTATYWPLTILAIAALLSHPAVLLNRGPGSHCWIWFSLLRTATIDSKLTRTSCSTRLYNCLTFTCSSEGRIWTQFNPSTVKVIPWYLRPDAPVIYTGVFLFDSSSRSEVNMLQRGNNPPTSVLDMTLNHQMVKLQSWGFE